MKKGWLIYNASLSSKKFNNVHELYSLSAKKFSIDLELVSNEEICSCLSCTGKELITSCDIPDFVIFLDKDIQLARDLEYRDIKVYNSSDTIELCDNKISMYKKLSENNIKIPLTIQAPLRFNNKRLSLDFINIVESKLNYPLVIKEAYGSFGEQVYLANNREEMLEKIDYIDTKPFLFQEFISSSYGKDIRIHVVGDKVVTSMLRYSDNDFRANISIGGKMEKLEVSKDFSELAIKVSNIFGADFSGVDLMLGEFGEPIVCEINSNAHIKNILDCTGVNVADDIFRYILEDLC